MNTVMDVLLPLSAEGAEAQAELFLSMVPTLERIGLLPIPIEMPSVMPPQVVAAAAAEYYSTGELVSFSEDNALSLIAAIAGSALVPAVPEPIPISGPSVGRGIDWFDVKVIPESPEETTCRLAVRGTSSTDPVTYRSGNNDMEAHSAPARINSSVSVVSREVITEEGSMMARLSAKFSRLSSAFSELGPGALRTNTTDASCFLTTRDRLASGYGQTLVTFVSSSLPDVPPTVLSKPAPRGIVDELVRYYVAPNRTEHRRPPPVTTSDVLRAIAIAFAPVPAPTPAARVTALNVEEFLSSNDTKGRYELA